MALSYLHAAASKQRMSAMCYIITGECHYFTANGCSKPLMLVTLLSNDERGCIDLGHKQIVAKIFYDVLKKSVCDFTITSPSHAFDQWRL